MADTLTEHQTCSTGTLSTWKHPHLVHNYGLAQHSSLFSPSSSCSSLSVPILVLPLHGIQISSPFPSLEGGVLGPGNTDHH